MRVALERFVSLVGAVALACSCSSSSPPSRSAASGPETSQAAAAGATETAVTSTSLATVPAGDAVSVVPALGQLARPIDGVDLPEPSEEEGLEHGDTAFGVYFAAVLVPPGLLESQAGFAALSAADEQLRQNFGGRFFGDRAQGGCDDGAVDALAAAGYPNATSYVVLHFSTEADAEQFAASVEPPPLAVAMVRTLCRD